MLGSKLGSNVECLGLFRLISCHEKHFSKIILVPNYYDIMVNTLT